MTDLKITRDGHVVTIALARPERMNTISRQMLSELSVVLQDCDDNPAVRAVILTAEGRVFSGGLDLKDAASEEGVAKGGFDLGLKLNLREFPPNVLYHMDTPTICALNGGAAGFGMDLALACDMRIAARSAKLAASYARQGILPDSGGTWFLPRLLGWAKATEIVFTGKTLHAEECLELGLVNGVVNDEDLIRTAVALANEIADCAPLAIQAAKRMMRAGMHESFDEHIQRVYLQVLPMLQSEDFKEGYTAFLERRKARFVGR